MQYYLDINDRAFLAIENGTKKVEIRVTTNPLEKDYSVLKQGDIITFSNSLDKKTDCIIKEINWYKNEKELLIQEGTRYTLSSTNDFEKGIESLTRFKGYKMGILKYGIYAIHIERIQSYHEMKLQTSSFNCMKFGTKNIEIRLNDEKRQLIKIGDIIKFIEESNSNNFFLVKVIGILKYKSFNDLINDFDMKYFFDKDTSKEELLKNLNEFYSEEKQKKYNAVGIKILKI